MPPQIGGTLIPDDIANKGQVYMYSPPRTVTKNGRGLAVTAGYATLIWTYQYLHQGQFDWWYTTLLGDDASRQYTGNGTTKLYNQQNVLTDHDSCIVHRPVYERTDGDMYYGVTVLIDRLVTTA